jgi:hypothetical protein
MISIALSNMHIFFLSNENILNYFKVADWWDSCIFVDQQKAAKRSDQLTGPIDMTSMDRKREFKEGYDAHIYRYL